MASDGLWIRPRPNVRVGSKAEVLSPRRDVSFGSNSGHCSTAPTNRKIGPELKQRPSEHRVEAVHIRAQATKSRATPKSARQVNINSDTAPAMRRFKRLRVRWPLMGFNPPNVPLANCIGRR
jgi:hypothetical protein